MSVMYYAFAEVILQVLQYTALFVVFFHKSIGKNHKKLIAVAVIVLLFCILTVTLDWESEEYYNYIACILISIILVGFKSWQVIIDIIMCLSLDELFSVIISCYCDIYFFGKNVYWESYVIIGLIFFILVCVFAYILIKKQISIILSLKYKITLILIPVALVYICRKIGIVSIVTEGADLTLSYLFYGVTIILILIVMYLCVRLIYLNSRGSGEIDEVREKYVESLSKYLDISKEKQDEIRSVRHDLKNHLSVISTLIDNGNYEKAAEYIKEVNNSTIEAVDMINCTGNDLLDAIILERSSFAAKNGISIKCKGTLNNNLAVSDFDFSTIVMNLINNAIEYSQQENFKYVNLEVYQDNNIEVYKVMNQIKDEYDIDSEIKTTKKADSKEHGIGLKNVERTVLKYRGEFSIYREGDHFIAKVVFYK
jgi:two-component system sensor histidine kinase AgrC